MITNWISRKSFAVSLAVFMTSGMVPAFGATFTEPQQQQAEGPEGRPLQDPIRKLNLTPEQMEEIRNIRESQRGERAEIGRRVRETWRALEEALESDAPDEAVVDQLLRDSAEAQAAELRLRILTELRIRRVFTPEQRETAKTLRQQARQLRRERSPGNPGVQRRGESFNTPRRQPNRNSMPPIRPGERRNQQGTPRP